MTVRSALRAPVRAAVRAPIILRKRWTPAALFAQGQQGVWLEASPTYKGQQVLWQQSDGTVIVDANGDPVGRADDLSPNGNNATQPASADRPLYQTDGALHWLEGNGSNQRIDIPDSSFVLSESQYMSVAFRPIASSASRYLFGGTSDAYFGLILNDGILRPYVATDSGAMAFNSSTVTNGVDYVVTVIWDKPAQQLVLRLNGSELERRSAPGTAIVSGVVFSLFSRGSTGNHINARVYGAIKGSYLPSSQQLLAGESYLADLAGITL